MCGMAVTMDSLCACCAPADYVLTIHLPGIEGKMLSSEVVNGAYAYDYTIEQKG